MNLSLCSWSLIQVCTFPEYSVCVVLGFIYTDLFFFYGVIEVQAEVKEKE